MELQRFAIVVAAVLLAGSLVFAAGRIAADDNVPRPAVPKSAPVGEAPVLRLGDGSVAHSSSMPLLPQPTAAATMTPRTRHDAGTPESDAAPNVSSHGDK